MWCFYSSLTIIFPSPSPHFLGNPRLLQATISAWLALFALYYIFLTVIYRPWLPYLRGAKQSCVFRQVELMDCSHPCWRPDRSLFIFKMIFFWGGEIYLVGKNPRGGRTSTYISWHMCESLYAHISKYMWKYYFKISTPNNGLRWHFHTYFLGFAVPPPHCLSSSLCSLLLVPVLPLLSSSL